MNLLTNLRHVNHQVSIAVTARSHASGIFVGQQKETPFRQLTQSSQYVARIELFDNNNN